MWGCQGGWKMGVEILERSHGEEKTQSTERSPKDPQSHLIELPEKLKVAIINILKDFIWGNIYKEMEILKWTFLQLESIISKILKITGWHEQQTGHNRRVSEHEKRSCKINLSKEQRKKTKAEK